MKQLYKKNGKFYGCEKLYFTELHNRKEKKIKRWKLWRLHRLLCDLSLLMVIFVDLPLVEGSRSASCSTPSRGGITVTSVPMGTLHSVYSSLDTKDKNAVDSKTVFYFCSKKAFFSFNFYTCDKSPSLDLLNYKPGNALLIGWWRLWIKFQTKKDDFECGGSFNQSVFFIREGEIK